MKEIKEPSKLIIMFSKPLYQALLVVAMTIVFSLIDKMMPHHTELLEINSGTWIVGTAMILCYIILNTIVALRIEPIIPYWSKSVTYYIGTLVFVYAWSYLLSGKSIDEAGSFRWLWLVLTLVYMVFFAIARSMKRIVDFALKQDEKLRGEE
jgi:hypothetical protein